MREGWSGGWELRLWLLRNGDCGVPVFFTQTWRGATPPFMIGLKISLGLKRNTATHCAFEKLTCT